MALDGGNGTGKSSLLKLLCGQDIPHAGQVRRAPGLVVSYVPQDAAGLAGDLTGFARAHGLDESLFKAILRKMDFSRVQFEKDMASFSSGQKKKVLLARSLCEKAHLYVWDEPLNFIDIYTPDADRKADRRLGPLHAVRGARRRLPPGGGHRDGPPVTPPLTAPGRTHTPSGRDFFAGAVPSSCIPAQNMIKYGKHTALL